jgi:hypothetical protein
MGCHHSQLKEYPMAKQGSDGETGAVPAANLWQGPMSWIGSPPQPVENFAREFPENATFVRGEVLLTLAEPIGPGMTRQTLRALPSLIHLDRGTPVEVHMPGLNGRCWTYRSVREGRKTRWCLFEGSTFNETTEPLSETTGASIEEVVVSSALPMYGTRRHVSFRIDAEGRAERFSNVSDPDPSD